MRDVVGGRYETEMRVLLLALARGRRVATVPIPTIYERGNPTSHFRPVADSARVWSALASALTATLGRSRRPAPARAA